MSTSHPSSTTSTRATPAARRRWFVDLQMTKGDRSALVGVTARTTTEVISSNSSALPVGYVEHGVVDNVKKEDDDHLLAKRSWDVASQPFKQLPMNMILAWMAGNSFSLMSIMIVVMLFMKPIQSIFSLSSAFASLEQEGAAGKIWLLKLTYFIGNLTHLALALYKCQSMGLLPTYNSDWIAFAEQQTQMEMSLGGYAYS